MTDILHELSDIWWSVLSEKEREGMGAVRVRATGRSTVKPPALAPFDFGINKEWWTTYKDASEFSTYLLDWNTHGDPQGFGQAFGTSDGDEDLDGPHDEQSSSSEGEQIA